MNLTEEDTRTIPEILAEMDTKAACYLALTEKGLDVSNYVMADFIM